jgi:predicted secreted protein
MPHTWKFFRAGGFDQVKLESGADLANLDQLDQKLWVALACPTRGLEFDNRTLDLIDTDKDGRIRAPEIIAAAKWATGLLKNPDDLIKGLPALPIASINDATPDGKQILASAKQILINLGKPDAAVIELAEATDTVKIFATTTFNGDGIIPADSADDDATKAAIADIMSCMGIETDRSGKPGVSQAKTDAFFVEAQAHSDWWKRSEGDQTILPLGEATAAASAAVNAVKMKVNDFFARCRLAAFDARAGVPLNRPESEYVALATKDLTVNTAEIASLPLAHIAAGKDLPLVEGVNPAWAGALAALQVAAVKPLLGDRKTLTEAEWNELLAKLAPFEAWFAGKVGAPVEKLGLKRVREILAGDAKEKITALIVKDKLLEPEANAIASVEKLVRLHRDLHLLCMNFVSFRNFYSRKTPAIFQAGRLYLDQRACDLVLTVEDVAAHAKMAALAGSYLAYCDCVRKGTGEKMQIVAAFTDGDSDNLMVGRNGVFYDRKGRDWDATITKLIDNPISIRQAFWLPYKKLVRMVEEQIAKRAAAAEAASTAKMQEAAVVTAQADKTKPAAPKKMDLGTIALLTTAFTAIAGILTTIFAKMTGLFGLGLLAIPAFVGVCVGLILLISGPSMILAYMKLRKRNLGPLLDANGWAVNSKAKVNVPLGRSLTQVAALPPGSQRDLDDPFAAKKFPWVKIIVVAALLVVIGGCWYYGKLDNWVPAKVTSLSVLGTNAPAYVPPTNTMPPVVSTNLPATPAP